MLVVLDLSTRIKEADKMTLVPVIYYVFGKVTHSFVRMVAL